MYANSLEKFRAVNDFPELVEYLGDELEWPIDTSDFEEMTFEYSAEELGLDHKTSPKFLEIRRLRPLDKDQPWGIFFIRFDNNTLPVVALRRLLSKLVLKKRGLASVGDRASWHENDLLLISQTGKEGSKSISFAHFASNPEKTDLPILKVLGWDDDDTGLKLDYVIETLRTKLRWPDDPTDSNAWRNQWRDAFILKNREVIQSSKEMAERLGQLALAVRTRLRELLAVESDEGPIHKLMSVFKENLISDLDTDSFSDMYAQTIAYGLLSARIINPKANTADAAHTQIPMTNPFLKDIMETFLNVGGRRFSDGIGLDFDELGINEVVDLLDNSNMEAVLRDFGDRNQKEDPVMHFFEGFLKEYDSKIRKDRGVFYTPQPVVSFIVRSVDEQLRTEFGLEDGLADTTTWGELAKRKTDLKIPDGISPDQVFVQILDPATGTGTFPVEVIDNIYKTMTSKWQSQGFRKEKINVLWNEYVPKFLLPRLHGYELMMAPYSIAHMKIGLKLHETGYLFNSDQRACIYLTNALEPAKDFSGTFAFAIPALAREATAVHAIKRAQRFTVIIGNPPYSNYGKQNSSDWMHDLLDEYKSGLNEKKMNLNDDYIKFIRFGHQLIDQNSVGILAFITNHSYLSGITHRRMRQSLQKSFNTIRILDLHGSVKLSEKTPDGGVDDNVFDIQQGVSIGIFSKTNKAPKVSHSDLWGKRQKKYDWLNSNTITDCSINILEPVSDRFYFVPNRTESDSEYSNFIPLSNIFREYATGFETARDHFAICFSEKEVLEKLDDLSGEASDDALRVKWGLDDKRDWTLENARQRLRSEKNKTASIIECCYRPFDNRFVYFDTAVVTYPRKKLLGQINLRNIALVATRMIKGEEPNHFFVVSQPTERTFISAKTSTNAYIFPSYGNPGSDLFSSHPDVPLTLVSNICDNFKETIQSHVGTCDEASQDIITYIYGVFFSPQYRTRYADFLKRDFPKVPIPKTRDLFIELCERGKELISLHLLQSPLLSKRVVNIIGPGIKTIEKVSYSNGTVWVDDACSSGFSGIPEDVWNFQIGGYRVCQKWMKDRQAKGGKNPREAVSLDAAAIEQYQKIVSSVAETIRIMAEIDEIINIHGSWPDAFINTASN